MNEDLDSMMEMSKKDMLTDDGLTTLQYKKLNEKLLPTHTWVLVKLPPPPPKKQVECDYELPLAFKFREKVGNGGEIFHDAFKKVNQSKNPLAAVAVGRGQVSAVERHGEGRRRRRALHLGPRQSRGHAEAARARAERRPPLLSLVTQSTDRAKPASITSRTLIVIPVMSVEQ